MDASSFRSTGIKMTIDNPDDFCSFKGKDIDFEDEKYDPFPVYRFKPGSDEYAQALHRPEQIR